MVRRHRVEESEVEPLMRAAALRLYKLMRENPSDVDVEPLFRVLWRFKEHRRGPPSYPDINQDTVNQLLYEIQGLLYGYDLNI